MLPALPGTGGKSSGGRGAKLFVVVMICDMVACAAVMLFHSSIAASYAAGRSLYFGWGVLGVVGERV
jgi:hypothetical protein